MPDGSEPKRARPARELPRRFYRDVEVIAVADGHGIALDARAVSTPARAPLRVPWRAVAEEIAAEWRGQGDRIRPETMPLTRLVNSALDGVAREREATVAEVVKFASTDLLFYRAVGPEALVARQTAAWDPIVAWAGEASGGRFRLAEGVVHVAQPEDLIERVRAQVRRFDDLPLAALHVATTLTGSALLALALAAGRLGADEAWIAAHVDEDWQMAQWGEDAEAMKRRNLRALDFRAAARVLEVARMAGR